MGKPEETPDSSEEPPHEARAAVLLDEKIRAALQYVGTEFVVTTATCIGVLMGQVHRLLHECQDDEHEDEDE